MAHLLTHNDSLPSKCEIFAIKTGPQPVLLAANTHPEFPRYLAYGAEVPIVTEAPFVDRCALTIDELHDALTITTGQKSWNKPSQKFRASTVSKLCGNLVVFDVFDGTLSLAHHTVHTFLKSPMVEKQEAVVEVAAVPAVLPYHLRYPFQGMQDFIMILDTYPPFLLNVLLRVLRRVYTL